MVGLELSAVRPTEREREEGRKRDRGEGCQRRLLARWPSSCCECVSLESSLAALTDPQRQVVRCLALAVCGDMEERCRRRHVVCDAHISTSHQTASRMSACSSVVMVAGSCAAGDGGGRGCWERRYCRSGFAALVRCWTWRIALLQIMLAITLGNSGVTAEQCAKDEFSCDKGGCLPRWYLCNGHVECPSPQDNSDETNCPSMLNCEGDGGVQCKHLNESRCWPQVYRCDNHTDCDGGEDEVGCDVWTMYLTETCRWSEWSECSLPTCNSQSRHPSPLSMQELLLAEFTDDWIPCSEANQTQSCVHVACSKKDGVGSHAIVLAAIGVLVTLVVLGCVLEVFLRRQMKRGTKLVKSDSEPSSNTTSSAGPLHSPQESLTPQGILMATLTRNGSLPSPTDNPAHQLQQRQLLQHAAPQQPTCGSVAGGSFVTAETTLDSITEATAEIRRSLAEAVSNQRSEEHERYVKNPSYQSDISLVQRERTSERRLLLSPIRQQQHSSPSDVSQANGVIASCTTISCPLCFGYNPGECCHMAYGSFSNAATTLQPHGKQVLPGNASSISKTPVVAIGDDERYRTIVLQSAEQYHQIQDTKDESSVVADERRSIPVATSGDDCSAIYAPTPYSAGALSVSSWPQSHRRSVQPDQLSEGCRFLLLANALKTGTVNGIGTTSTPGGAALDDALWRPIALENHSTASSKHARSHAPLPCSTPASNIDVHSSSLEENAPCNGFFGHAPQLAVSGAA
ncbi:uncharacterized protein LOC135813947 [Sycon ciliatum]|uniref:uncharacterized protein LOC135813947 n=1 Tax=Sycon ciliatum TaxID=27933 RepID=UPI0031F70728